MPSDRPNSLHGTIKEYFPISSLVLWVVVGIGSLLSSSSPVYSYLGQPYIDQALILEAGGCSQKQVVISIKQHVMFV